MSKKLLSDFNGEKSKHSKNSSGLSSTWNNQKRLGIKPGSRTGSRGV